MIDPYAGQTDLKKKIIRSVRNPKLRFQEDYSRILRGLRFSAQLQFVIEDKTFKAMGKFSKNLQENKFYCPRGSCRRIFKRVSRKTRMVYKNLF